MAGLHDGEVALVTGGAGGIGRATARLLGERGAAVGVLDVDDAGAAEAREELAAAGLRCAATVADVSSAAETAAAVEAIAAELGPITILVNNAARLGDDHPILETDEASWEGGLGVSLTGAYNCVRAALPLMLGEGRGAIVNVSSVAAIIGFPGHTTYNTAKAGLIQLARSVAIDYGRQGIRANTVVPGSVRTGALYESNQDDQQLAFVKALNALDRIAEPVEVARAVSFLCSEEASFVTGTTLVVDGGWVGR